MFSFHRADGPSGLKASNHGNLIEQVEQLLEQRGVTAPPSSGVAWGQIFDYADKNGLPIHYAPVLAGNGVKLACTDADTQAAAIAWAADKIQTDNYLRMGRTDGEGCNSWKPARLY